MNVIETSRLGKRYGGTWALRDCTLTITALDPLARQDFLASVMTAMADDGMSVLLSSHALAELERVADYLIVLSGGQLRLAGETDDLLATHRILTDPATEADKYARQLHAVQVKRAEAQAHLLVGASGPAGPVPPGWEAHPVSLEELTLAYLRAPGSAGLPGPSPLQHTEPAEAAR
jgi:ABC-2 type transport system ATP-binding protein